jgi:hypothetical protein
MPEHPPDPAELPTSFRELSPRQQKFVLSYVRGLNSAQAARDAGSQAIRPDNAGYAMRRNSGVQQALADLLALNGISDVRLLRKLSDLLDARKASVKYDERRGKWEYSKQVPDHPTQLAALDMVLRVKAAYPREGQQPGSYTLIISQEQAQSEPGQPPASSPGTERHQRGHLTLELPPGDP